MGLNTEPECCIHDAASPQMRKAEAMAYFMHNNRQLVFAAMDIVRSVYPNFTNTSADDCSLCHGAFVAWEPGYSNDLRLRVTSAPCFERLAYKRAQLGSVRRIARDPSPLRNNSRRWNYQQLEERPEEGNDNHTREHST